jgi:ribosomal protein S18 acetylase RimI-like enzyme
MCWVLERENSSLVGSISVVKEWSDWHAGYYWWIQSLFIRPEYRGRNLVGLLMEAVAKKARREDAVQVRLYVHRENVRAIKAYRRQGFSEAPYLIMQLERPHAAESAE